MQKLIVRLLLKYQILQVIGAKETFFKTSLLAKKVKLSPELIKLNYEKLSPIKNPAILSYKDEDLLYLWFLNRDIADDKILIPESFLLYKSLHTKEDGIYVFETSPSQIYVIRAKKLKTAFSSHVSADTINLSIIKNEYALNNVEVLSKKEHDKLLQNALETLSLRELFTFTQLKIDKEHIKNFFIDKLTYPLVSLLFAYMLVSYTQSYFMQKKVNALTQEYQSLKSKNSKLKNAIRTHNRDVEKLQSFLEKEFAPVEPFKVVNGLYEVIKPDDKSSVNFLSITNGMIKIKIQTKDNAIKYLKRFNSVPYLTDIILDNTYKPRNGKKVDTFTMKIKSDHE